MTAKPQPADPAHSGIGRLLRAGKPLAKVFYYLDLRPVADKSEMVGKVTVSQDTPMRSQVIAVLDSDEALTLELSDGRRLDVHTTRGNQFSGEFHIVALNPPGAQ